MTNAPTDRKSVDISRERLEHLQMLGVADYLHMALRAALDEAEASLFYERALTDGAQRRARAAEAERDRLADAMREIAAQKKTDELETEYDVEVAAFEDGYDLCIDRARATLAKMEKTDGHTD